MNAEAILNRLSTAKWLICKNKAGAAKTIIAETIDDIKKEGISMYYEEEQIEMKELLTVEVKRYSWLLTSFERMNALICVNNGKLEEAQEIIDRALAQFGHGSILENEKAPEIVATIPEA